MPRLFLRIFFDGLMLGPGKIELLMRIRARGSIAAAGREMGMSYRRAWSLVEEMNAAFVAPVVTSTRGGAGGGGARVTATGEAVISHYRAIYMTALSHGAQDIAALEGMLRPADANTDPD